PTGDRVLAHETCPRRVVVCKRRAQNLERNLGSRAFVACSPNFRLPAGAQLFQQGVTRARHSSRVSSVSLGHGLTGVPGSGFSIPTFTGALVSAGGVAVVADVVAGVVPDAAAAAAAPPVSSRYS